jgi:hypothetical protein
MKKHAKQNVSTLEKIRQGRERTNLLGKYEQQSIAFLVERIPAWVTSDMLTAFGLFGSIVTFLGFVFARTYNRYLLLVSIAGFVINWFGDSLDGRLAYYRNRPRKWYGFSLDFCTDWITAILIGLGYMIYDNNSWELFGFFFTAFYGLEMMIALLRYKIVNVYSIDSGVLGPTEVRIILALILILETVAPGSIIFSVIGGCLLLVVMSVLDFIKLLKLADEKDREEREAGNQAESATTASPT